MHHLFTILFAIAEPLASRCSFGETLHDALQDLHARLTGDWHHMHLPARPAGCTCTLFGPRCELHSAVDAAWEPEPEPDILTPAQLEQAVADARANIARFGKPEADGYGEAIGPDPLLVEHWRAVLAELLAS